MVSLISRQLRRCGNGDTCPRFFIRGMQQSLLGGRVDADRIRGSRETKVLRITGQSACAERRVFVRRRAGQ